MTRRVLLDTQLLIGAFEPKPGSKDHQDAGIFFRQLMSDDDVEVFITPLIRFEVLRGVRRISRAEMEAELDKIQELPVGTKEANRATDLYCLAESKGFFQPGKNDKKICPECGYPKPPLDKPPLDKRSFDLLHCACADVNGLEIESKDRHIQTIQKLIQECKQNA